MDSIFLQIEHLLHISKPNDAIKLIDSCINQCNTLQSSYAYYLRGNAYWQLGNRRMAINNYNKSIEIDPNSPAKTALRNANDILDFFNHDIYNP